MKVPHCCDNVRMKKKKNKKKVRILKKNNNKTSYPMLSKFMFKHFAKNMRCFEGFKTTIL